MRNGKAGRGFSLIELVIVVVIIGIIAAIAIPRLSRGSAGAADSALIGDLAVMRSSIDLYVTEHVGSYPALVSFNDQMTLYTNAAGATATSKGGAYIYGPCLRAIPPLPIGAQRGESSLKAVPPDGGAGFGWAYDQSNGDIKANTAGAELDDAGKAYNTY